MPCLQESSRASHTSTASLWTVYWRPEQNLLNLTLSLAEVANAVELFKTQPGVIYGFDPERFLAMHEQECSEPGSQRHHAVGVER